MGGKQVVIRITGSRRCFAGAITNADTRLFQVSGDVKCALPSTFILSPFADALLSFAHSTWHGRAEAQCFKSFVVMFVFLLFQQLCQKTLGKSSPTRLIVSTAAWEAGDGKPNGET